MEIERIMPERRQGDGAVRTIAENRSVVVLGGGVGGLSAAIAAAARGCEVTLVERAAGVGGKMRELSVGGRPIDSGPTVMTMRWAFDELFAVAGRRLDDHVRLVPLEVLARHGWPDGGRLDLFTDVERSAAAIEVFAGPREAEGYRRFCSHTQRIFSIVEQPFLRSERPRMLDVLTTKGPRGWIEFAGIDWHRSMWRALGSFFADPRLRQLFGRYATYYGSSPFLAPATLNLIAHVERSGVWRVEGGMARLADALAELARSLGVVIRTACEVESIVVEDGRAVGVRVRGSDAPLRADAVIVNAAPQALDEGRFGERLRGCLGLPAGPRSLSAITWSMLARTRGFPLAHHNVLFSRDYVREFGSLDAGELPDEPTVYVCAQDRDERGPDAPTSEWSEPERLLVLINSPARGDEGSTWLDPDRIEHLRQRSLAVMAACGLELDIRATTCTTPVEFEQLFPSTGGALYGTATHSMLAPFRRPQARTRVPGLYLAGGGAHPGAGVPMVCLSGQLAGRAVAEDLLGKPALGDARKPPSSR